jgi:hypothetical protein
MSGYKVKGAPNALSVKLPLAKSSADGWQLIQTLQGLVKQNLKMILLTHEGERVMEPNFGVGMSSYLFKNFNEGTYAEIEFKIREQVARYLPIVAIDNIIFDTTTQDFNELYMALEYSIPDINVKDILEFTV